jgi:hypothetical protein
MIAAAAETKANGSPATAPRHEGGMGYKSTHARRPGRASAIAPVVDVDLQPGIDE